jgi:hypothetical protein
MKPFALMHASYHHHQCFDITQNAVDQQTTTGCTRMAPNFSKIAHTPVSNSYQLMLDKKWRSHGATTGYQQEWRVEPKGCIL